MGYSRFDVCTCFQTKPIETQFTAKNEAALFFFVVVRLNEQTNKKNAAFLSCVVSIQMHSLLLCCLLRITKVNVDFVQRENFCLKRTTNQNKEKLFEIDIEVNHYTSM